MSEVKREWSAFQRAIFDEVHHGSGHLVIKARAGSGKSSTLLEALEYVPPNKRVFFGAFNESIVKKLEKEAPPNVTASTLHAFGLQTIVQWADWRVNVNRNKTDEYLPKSYKYEQRKQILDMVRLAKNSLASTKDEVDALLDIHEFNVKDEERSNLIDRVLDTMRRSEQDLKTVDFDDMVWLPIIKDLPVRQYPYVFVDEVQDLSLAQRKLILRSCRPDGGRIIAVGDDRQACYEWRGADANSIPNFIEELNAKVLPLSITYRCPKRVVTEAQAIVPDIEAAPWAPLGLVATVSGVNSMVKLVQPGDVVLSRYNAPLVGLCLDLLSVSRPAAIVGRDIGTGLVTLLRQSKTTTTLELAGWIANWSQKEIARLVRKNRSTKHVEDRVDCVLGLSRNLNLTSEVVHRIETLFSDEDDGRRVLFSTTHKFKGLERDRVFVLKWTYRSTKSVSEDNLWYIAVTRSKDQLYLVEK